MSDTFTCAICGGTFDSDPADTEEALAAQLTEEFPGFAPEECDRACDGCYQKHFGTPTGRTPSQPDI